VRIAMSEKSNYHKGGLALRSSERRKRHAQAYCGGC